MFSVEPKSTFPATMTRNRRRRGGIVLLLALLAPLAGCTEKKSPPLLPPAVIDHLEMAPGGKLLAVGVRGEVKMLDPETGDPKCVIQPNGSYSSMCFSSDGTKFIT